MAKRVINVFADLALTDERTSIAQHQKHFPRNVIARLPISGKTYLKVPFTEGETLIAGLTVEQFNLLARSAGV